MLLEHHTRMLPASRCVAACARRRAAAWGCARLATSRSSQQLGGSLPTQNKFLPCQINLIQHRHSIFTSAVVQTRESPVVLDPGDYEAGQIQARHCLLAHDQHRFRQPQALQ